jgi:hypothetical protein
MLIEKCTDSINGLDSSYIDRPDKVRTAVLCPYRVCVTVCVDVSSDIIRDSPSISIASLH